MLSGAEQWLDVMERRDSEHLDSLVALFQEGFLTEPQLFLRGFLVQVAFFHQLCGLRIHNNRLCLLGLCPTFLFLKRLS